MGRPPISDPRNHQLNLSFTEAEINLLRRRADQAQMYLFDYGRLILLRKSSSARVAASVAQIDRVTYEQLKRLGNNLNQIARVVNATRSLPPRGLEELLRDIRLVLNRGAILGP
jgi:hypothetical protein